MLFPVIRKKMGNGVMRGTFKPVTYAFVVSTAILLIMSFVDPTFGLMWL